MVSLVFGCSTLLVLSAYCSGVVSHETENTSENPKEKPVIIQHPVLRWAFTPRLGKRVRDIDESMFYTPRLGKRISDNDDDVYSMWESTNNQRLRDDSEYSPLQEERREGKEERIWKIVPFIRLGRNPSAQIRGGNFKYSQSYE